MMWDTTGSSNANLFGLTGEEYCALSNSPTKDTNNYSKPCKTANNKISNAITKKKNDKAFTDRDGNQLDIKKVIFGGNATIVYWSDRSKTVVRCDEENYDKEKGLAMAIIKRLHGNVGKYYEIFKEYCYD